MNNKLLLIAILAFVLNNVAFTQIQKPAKWTVELSKKEAKVGEKIDIIFKASIEDSWHTYSNDFDPDLGPILISFEFEDNSTYATVGKVKPINPHKKYDKIWEGEVSYFEKTAELRQTIIVKKLPMQITGYFEYQSCSDVTGMCVMDDDEFDLKT